MDWLTLLFFITGFPLLIFGAELLVRGASRVAVAAGISPLVVGLTVVAYGTSAPELAVSVQSSYTGAVDIAVGNVVGSNIANVLLILGLSAAIAPLIVAAQLVQKDVPLMIGLSLLVWFMAWNGVIDRLEGLILFIGAIAYTVFAIWQSRKETKAIQQEFEQEYGLQREKKGPHYLLIQLGLVVVGVGLLVLGANWLVNGAVAIAQFFGISQLIIGLTVVAVGTSLPELATSVVASIRGERDIAVGNVVGSNIFNILTVLGLSSALAPEGIPVSVSAINFDIPIMIAVAIACLPIFFTRHLIARWEGFLFLGYYLAYTIYLVLQAAQPHTIPLFNTMMLFVLPLTFITLLVSLIRAIRLNASKGLWWDSSG